MPMFQLKPKLSEIEFGERSLSTLEILDGPFQNRARAGTVPGGHMVKGDRQLHHSLNSLSRRMTARQRVPELFEFLVSVEEAGAVE